MPPEVHDDARFKPNSAYWDDPIEVEFQYQLNLFFAVEPPTDWFDPDDDVLTNTSDEDFWAGVERENGGNLPRRNLRRMAAPTTSAGR